MAPLFLKNNRRIVICLALLIFCLITRQTRLAVAPQTTLDGLHVGQPAESTSRLIFKARSGLRLGTADELLRNYLWLLPGDPTRSRCPYTSATSRPNSPVTVEAYNS